VIELRAGTRLPEAEASDLARLLEAEDGAFIETEGSLNARREMPCIFQARESGRLVGALAVFAPRSDEAEISAFVLPSRRRMGVFSSLLSAAEPELSRFGYSSELFVVDGRSGEGKAVAARIGADYAFTEFAMSHEGAGPIVAATGSGLDIKLLGPDAVEALAALRSTAFGDSLEDASNFERSIFASPDRRQYGAFLGGGMIGACSARIADGEAWIYGLAVEEASRGKGYGRAIIEHIVAGLSGRGLRVCLEVESRNDAALGLYRRAGFVARSSKSYFRRASDWAKSQSKRAGSR
jgi:ribosomal protein S18 acetylase RimI-like enzyme